jgi:hypothetical protein
VGREGQAGRGGEPAEFSNEFHVGWFRLWSFRIGTCVRGGYS